MEEERYKRPRSRIFGEGLERINAFSDGIFAIAITLLVLEIHIPDLSVPVIKNNVPEFPPLSERLWDLSTQMWTFALSFLVIGVYWMLHHGIFSYIKRYDTGLLWLNNFFLLTIAFQPFPTAVLGDYGSTTVAVVFYAVIQMLSGVFKLLIWVYASYKHRLIDADLDDRFIRYYTFQSTSTILIFGFSIILAFVNNDVAKYSWLLLAVDGPLIRLIYPPAPRKDKGKDPEELVSTDFGPAPANAVTSPKTGPVAPAEESGQSKTDKD